MADRQGRIFLGRDNEGRQQYHWVGRYRTRRERDEAVAAEKRRIAADGCDCSAMGREAPSTGDGDRVVLTVDPALRSLLERLITGLEARP